MTDIQFCSLTSEVRVRGSMNVRRRGPSGRVPQMRDAHVTREVSDALAVGEDLGGHAVPLALVDPATLGHGDTGGILSPLVPMSA